jgi:BNR repeat-like domain
MRSLDNVPGRVKDIWRIPGRFTKNPDLIRFPDGRMMLVFCDDDQHWSEEISRITTLESTNNGATWGNPRLIAEADRRKGQERWITPRISLLRSGKVVVICDHDDYEHVHQNQTSGIWMWTSDDHGRTWSKPKLTGIPGIEPDRVIELADGTLLIAAHMVFERTRKIGQFVTRSRDSGATWSDLAIVASNPVHNLCEGAIVVLHDRQLACVMRDNLHAGYPSYVSFSHDSGHNWSRIQALPFSGDRPYAAQLRDGRALVTYRNQAGNKGTHAWVGDLDRDAGYQISGTHHRDQLSCSADGLTLGGGKGAVTRYDLLPPESFWSDVVFEATVSVHGPADEPCGVVQIGRLGIRLDFCSNCVWMHRGPLRYNLPETDRLHYLDLTRPHAVRLEVIGGKLQVSVDGTPVMYWVIISEWPIEETYFGRAAESSGEVHWQHIRYQTKNQSEPEFEWTWAARENRLPDQYQLDHVLELHANPPRSDGYAPDNGYSSWVEMPDGGIYFVDYTNRGDPKPTSHLYRVIFSLSDFETAPRGS